MKIGGKLLFAQLLVAGIKRVCIGFAGVMGHDGFNVAVKREAAGYGFGGELGFEFGLEVHGG